jgi:hypothetical protein
MKQIELKEPFLIFISAQKKPDDSPPLLEAKVHVLGLGPPDIVIPSHLPGLPNPVQALTDIPKNLISIPLNAISAVVT